MDARDSFKNGTGENETHWFGPSINCPAHPIPELWHSLPLVDEDWPTRVDHSVWLRADDRGHFRAVQLEGRSGTLGGSRALANCLRAFEGECWGCQLVNLTINDSPTVLAR